MKKAFTFCCVLITEWRRNTLHYIARISRSEHQKP